MTKITKLFCGAALLWIATGVLVYALMYFLYIDSWWAKAGAWFCLMSTILAGMGAMAMLLAAIYAVLEKGYHHEG